MTLQVQLNLSAESKWLTIAVTFGTFGFILVPLVFYLSIWTSIKVYECVQSINSVAENQAQNAGQNADAESKTLWTIIVEILLFIEMLTLAIIALVLCLKLTASLHLILSALVPLAIYSLITAQNEYGLIAEISVFIRQHFNAILNTESDWILGIFTFLNRLFLSQHAEFVISGFYTLIIAAFTSAFATNPRYDSFVCDYIAALPELEKYIAIIYDSFVIFDNMLMPVLRLIFTYDDAFVLFLVSALLALFWSCLLIGFHSSLSFLNFPTRKSQKMAIAILVLVLHILAFVITVSCILYYFSVIKLNWGLNVKELESIFLCISERELGRQECLTNSIDLLVEWLKRLLTEYFEKLVNILNEYGGFHRYLRAKKVNYFDREVCEKFFQTLSSKEFQSLLETIPNSSILGILLPQIPNIPLNLIEQINVSEVLYMLQFLTVNHDGQNMIDLKRFFSFYHERLESIWYIVITDPSRLQSLINFDKVDESLELIKSYASKLLVESLNLAERWVNIEVSIKVENTSQPSEPTGEETGEMKTEIPNTNVYYANQTNVGLSVQMKNAPATAENAADSTKTQIEAKTDTAKAETRSLLTITFDPILQIWYLFDPELKHKFFKMLLHEDTLPYKYALSKCR